MANSSTITWDDISAWDSTRLAEFLRGQGFKVASALVWLENSSRASGERLANWAKAVEGLRVAEMRSLIDKVYLEDTETFRSFGIFAGMHSSVPLWELEKLRNIGSSSNGDDNSLLRDATRELISTQEMDCGEPVSVGEVAESSVDEVEEVLDCVIEETQPPYGYSSEVLSDEEGRGLGAGPCGRAEVEGYAQRRASKRLSLANNIEASKRRRSSESITTAPTRRIATAKSSPVARSRLPTSRSTSPVARVSSGGRRSSISSNKVLMLSGVGAALERTANSLCNRLGGAKIENLDRCLEKGVCPKPTHVVVPSKKVVVTLKVLYGLCTPTCSIIGEEWLIDCRSASKWLPVDSYLVDEWAGRPRWTVGKNGPLEKIRIHFSGEMQSIPDVEHYHNLVRLCGGVVDKESPRGARVVVVGRGYKLPARLLFDLKHGVVPTPALVTEEWLMQCLKTQTFIDEFDKYLPANVFELVPEEWHD